MRNAAPEETELRKSSASLSAIFSSGDVRWNGAGLQGLWLCSVDVMAWMRKLLVILNAIVRDGRPWRYNPAPT